MAEEIQKNPQLNQNENSETTEKEEALFQKFQMMDKPYQKFIDKKAAMGQKNFSFIPPKKQTAEEDFDDISVEEKSQPEIPTESPVNPINEKAETGDKPIFPQGESLPNPYGDAGWKSFDFEKPDFGIPEINTQPPIMNQPVQQPVNGQFPQKPKGKRNTGLVIFLVAVAVIFCAVAAWYISLIYIQKGETAETSLLPDNTTEESTQYMNYLRDDVSIELVPQSVSGESSAESAYEKIMPSTVLIISTLGDWNDNYSEVFQGTGVVIHSDGYIVTNSHVINNTRNGNVVVVDNLGNMSDATVVGYDVETDIAVLKIDRSGLEPAEFAETENVKVGQEIVALGNPEGAYFRNSFTKGIISAVNRRFDSDTSYIQVDAAINPGNSGGPLCNMEGQIIGINTSKLIKENFEGIAFAIPSDTVREVANDIIKYGEVRERLTLGIYGYRITQEDSEKENIPVGVLIDDIIPHGPVYKSPLQVGDVLISIDGETVDSIEDIKRILYEKSEGDVIEVVYMRAAESDDSEAGVEWQENSCEIELFYF